MKNILVLSLNAAIDRIVSVENLKLGNVHRTKETFYQAGGKGINVARALKGLGCNVLLFGLSGGKTGEQIAEDLHRSHIPSLLFPIAAQSRNCYIILDRSTGEQTVINEAGPEITAQEYSLFYKKVEELIQDTELLICSGSLPLGLPHSCYADFVSLAHKQSIPTLVDATGEALRLAVEAKPFLVKPNKDEAEELLGRPVTTDNSLEAAREIHSLGATVATISLGSDGASAVWQDGQLYLPAPKVTVINAVASGDAFLAGCAWALVSGLKTEEIIGWGVAAGSANATVGGAHIDKALVETFYQKLLY